MSDTDRTLLVYSNAVHIYNAANTSVRDMNTTDAVAANSATQGCVIIPDPAAPFSQYYLFIANDLTAGLRANKGIYYYRLQKSGASISVLSGPTQIATSTQVDESIYASPDLNGGYWVITKAQGINEVWSWRVTTTGISAVNKTTTSPYVGGTANGAIKINQCQNKIAIVGNGHLQVFDWDASTGKPGTNRFSKNYSAILYGVEFSPDGNFVYISKLATPELIQVRLSDGAETVLSTSSLNNNNQIGGIQLGRDGKIYVANAAFNQSTSVQIGTVHAPNSFGTGSNYNNPSAFSLPTSSVTYMPSVYIGMANQPWLNPRSFDILTGASGCVEFREDLRTYYGKKVQLRTDASLRWDFGDGAGWRTGQGLTPTFNYTSNGIYTVKIEGKDQLCGHNFATQRTLNVTCVLPVDWLFSDVRIVNQHPTITFGTTKEYDVSHYEIYRSVDGQSFTKVGQLAPIGNNSNKVNHYTWSDNTAPGGMLYYRVDQYDLNQNVPNSSRTLSIYHQVSSTNARLIKVSDSGYQIENMDINGKVMIYDITGRLMVQSELKNGAFDTQKPSLKNQVVVMKVVDEQEHHQITKTMVLD